ncbi:MAG: Uma2 family endonuclease [Thermoanaerobaculia bacterium]
MALHDLSRKLTYEDYLLIPEDGRRHEIIDGEHYVTAAPFVPHQDLVVELTFRLRGFLKAHRIGRLLIAPTDVLLSPHDIVQPDLLFISNQRASIAGLKNIQGAPDLAIEILSKNSARLDKILKLKAYELWGVQEYWMFDPGRKGVQPWVRTGESFEAGPFLSAATGGVLTTPLLPGFELPLAELFEDLP